MTRRANGHAIRAIREALGIPQHALAARVGVSKSQLSKIEHNASGASPEVLRKIADELGVTTDAVSHPVAAASA